MASAHDPRALRANELVEGEANGPTDLEDHPASLDPCDISTVVAQCVLDIAALPNDQDISLDGILNKTLVADRKIRSLFASDPQNSCLSDFYLGLIDVFNIAPEARRIRARIIKPGTVKFLDHYAFPLDKSVRKTHLEPSTVPDIETFRDSWELFTHKVLSKMTTEDWKNVIVAGGSVLACLLSTSTRSANDLNDLYQGPVWNTSDVDLFIWGLSTQEARAKMQTIYNVVCASCRPWDVTCVRKVNTVSIHTVYPSRPIQIILRLYASPAEVLAGFDVDAACCAFDGQRVWVNPRSLTALVRQANTIDMTRRSPSYEMRLAKYAERGFEIYIPSLSRHRVNPEIYDKNLTQFPNGLARLLVLERLYNGYNTYTYLKYPKTRVDLGQKVAQEDEDPLAGITEDTPQLPKSYYEGELRWTQIPYGVSWDARRITRLIANKDAWVNSPHNKRNRGQQSHKHVIFAGSMAQCISGKFCGECILAEDIDTGDIRVEDGMHIQGPVSFLTVNPGRQLITGSFCPIDDEDWVEEAYISGPSNAEPYQVHTIWALLQPGFVTN